MAFGGVAIGNINAQLAAIVVGINMSRISSSSPMATPAITGQKIATKATLLISSVINKTTAIKIDVMTRVEALFEETIFPI